MAAVKRNFSDARCAAHDVVPVPSTIQYGRLAREYATRRNARVGSLKALHNPTDLRNVVLPSQRRFSVRRWLWHWLLVLALAPALALALALHGLWLLLWP